MKKLLLLPLVAVAIVAGIGLWPASEMVLPGGHRIDIDGRLLRYVQQGAGPDVVLIHGVIGSAEDWQPLVPLLAARHRVTAVDLLGHGGSELRPGAHNLAGNAAALTALGERLDIKDAVVVGHSYGGAIALKLAADRWPRARGYVLLAPATTPDDPPAIDRAVAWPVLGLGLARLARPWVAEDMIRSELRAAVSPDEARVPADFIATRVARWNRAEVLHAYSQQHVAFGDELVALRPRYARIERPVVILQGGRDSYAALIDGARELARALPRARLIELSTAGHYLQYAEPAAVVAAVAAARE